MNNWFIILTQFGFSVYSSFGECSRLWCSWVHRYLNVQRQVSDTILCPQERQEHTQQVSLAGAALSRHSTAPCSAPIPCTATRTAVCSASTTTITPPWTSAAAAASAATLSSTPRCVARPKSILPITPSREPAYRTAPDTTASAAAAATGVHYKRREIAALYLPTSVRWLPLARSGWAGRKFCTRVQSPQWEAPPTLPPPPPPPPLPWGQSIPQVAQGKIVWEAAMR